MRQTIIFCLILAASCAHKDSAPAPDVQSTETQSVPTGQLPSDVTPIHYGLHLDIDPDEARFSGKVEIITALSKARRTIFLHGENLDVTDAYALVGDKKVPATWSVEAPHGVAQLRFDEELPKGEVSLLIEFNAPFGQDLNGLHTIVESDVSYAFTQFESHFARKAFPCFDEPRFKTPFDISLTVQKDHVAIATTQERSRQIEGDKVTIQYQSTEKLPTYLLAFAVGPLDVVQGVMPANAVRKQTLPFRGIAAKGKGDRLKYALENTEALLTELENYFGIPYPYDKLDIIAVPDFTSGAMENVGAVTFREYLLLVDEKNAPVSQKQAFNYVMAHELAHMWFGNLVTMPWWDDIWLNEAFATWMGMRVTANVNPQDQAEVGFLERIQYAMGADSLVNARQIRNPINSTDDIRNAFDSITYSKGGGVLTMFERYMGREAFQAGLRAYMEKHRFGSATYEDLLAAFKSKTEKDVVEPFKSFLFQAGVPMVQSEVVCSDDKATLKLKQSRYLPVGSAGERERTWQIPVCAKYSVNAEVKSVCTVLDKEEGAVDLGAVCPAWVLPNEEGAGYYRWSSDEKNLRALMSAFKELSVKERVSLASNLNAAFAGAKLSVPDFMALMPQLVGDEHRAVNSSPMESLSFVRDRIFDKDEDLAFRQGVQKFGRELYGAKAKALGFQAKASDSPDRKKMRVNVASFMALKFDDKATLERLAEMAKLVVGTGKGGDNKIHIDKIDADFLGLALTSGVKIYGAPFFEHLKSLYVTSDDALFRSAALKALTSSQDAELGNKVRALLLSGEVRGNELLTGIRGVLSRAQRDETWKWFKANYDEIIERLPDGRRGSITRVMSAFCDQTRTDEVAAFLDGKVQVFEGGARNFALAKEQATLCIARVKAHDADARKTFAKVK